MAKSKIKNQPLMYFFILLPVITYFALIARYALNIPVLDDYNVFLKYINLPFKNRYSYIFTLHNEHLIAFSRFIAELMYLVLGKINFVYLNLIGNASLIVIAALMFRIFSKSGAALFFFIPIPYFVFTAQSWSIMTWSTSSIQFGFSALFSLAAFVYFHKKGYLNFGVSILFAILAILNQGSGTFVLITMVLWILSGFIVKKPDFTQKPLLVKTSIVLVLAISALYFHLSRLGASGSGLSIDASFSGLMNIIGFFAVLTGSYAGNTALSYIAGALTLTAIAYLTKKKAYTSDPALYFFIVFLIITISAITLSRANFGIPYALSSRYIIYSVLILISTYILIIPRLPVKLLRSADFRLMIILFTITFTVFSISKGRNFLQERKDYLEAGLKSWYSTGRGLNSGTEPQQQIDGTRIMRDSIKKGTYMPPDRK